MKPRIASFAVCLAIASAASAQDAVDRQLQAALNEAARGDVSAALADIKAALALDPKRANGWYQLGSILGEVGDFPSAEAALRRSIELEPHSAKAHYSLALTLIGNPQSRMDWAGAIAECREALKLQPDYPQALNLLGAGLSATGQPDAAIPELRRAVQLSPGLAEAHFNLGLALESKDRLDEAASEYRAAVEARGAYPEATSALGSLLARMGKNAEAERELDRALRFNPDLASAHYALSRLLRGLGRKDEAAVEFAETKELTERPSNGVEASQLSNQALAIAAKGSMAEASGLLRQAIALKPDYGVPRYNLGLVLADNGDAAKALQELAKAISLLPGQPKAWFDYGRVSRLAHDDRGALAAVAWAARLSPNDPAIQSELASLRASIPIQDSGRFQESAARPPNVGAASDSATGHRAFALELMQRGDFLGAAGELLRALTLDPAAIDARRELAESYANLGDRHRAILEWHKVLRCVEDDVPTRIALGKALLREGDAAGAIDQLRLALRYRPGSAEATTALHDAERAASKP